MAERKRNPEKEREHSKKAYEKIKLRLATDPEFAEEYKGKKREEQRRRMAKIKADPVKHKAYLAKQRELNNKYKNLNPEKIRINEIRRQHRKKAKLTLKQIEAANKIRMKRFENSFLTQEQKNQEYKNLRKKLKADKDVQFFDLYGFTYSAYCNQRRRLKLYTLEEVIQYRIKHNLAVKEELKEGNYEIPKPKPKPQPKSQPKKIIPVQVADEQKPTNKPMKIKQTKEQAFRNIQLRIIDLERVLSSQPQELKIRVDYLRNQFVSQYGAMPI